MIKIFIHCEKEKEESTAIQYAEIIRKNPEITVVFVRVLHVPEHIGIRLCHENGMGSARIHGDGTRYKYMKKYIDPNNPEDTVEIPDDAIDIRHEDYYVPIGSIQIEVSWLEPVEDA